MQCGNCGTENPAGMKFCGNCAAPLRNLCPKCGFENPPGFKFCGQCAATLSSPAPAPAERPGVRVPEPSAALPEGERKNITALFADIKGSMELIEDLDPEEARAIVDPAIARMIDAVHHYGGYLVQSTGDGIFALFGAPVALEDHPQRALYAALKMQDEMRRYSAELRHAGRSPVEIRIGVNTGEAVVRTIPTGEGDAEYTPIGHAVSLASRMQTLAPSGSIVIAEETRKVVAGYFELKSLGVSRIKGVSEPIEIFEVTGLGPLRTRLQRSAIRGLSRFVGRTAEMDQMKRVAELARGGHGQIVAAVAEAGVGKSRLFFEFEQTLSADWLVLQAFSVSHGRASSYLPVIELLKGYFRIVETDDERARREKITGRVLALDRSLEDTLPYFFPLMGVSEASLEPSAKSKADPRREYAQFWEQSLDRLQLLTSSGAIASIEGMEQNILRTRTKEAIKRLLLRESLNQPMAVVFEDLHWIDDRSSEVLALLADSIASAQVLLMVNYRPEYHHQWGNKLNYTQLRLDPLAAESAGELLDGLLGAASELRPLKEMIVQRTEGNPFFIEEMIQALLEEGVLARNGEIKLAKPLSGARVPPTVKGVIAARIDRLSPAGKELVQTLAVVGKEFSRTLIRSVTAASDHELEPLLSALQVGEFIFEQPAVPEPDYVFKHALTQEVAYDSILSDRRRAIHDRAARAIEEIYANQIDDHLDELANHHSRSGNAEKAVEYLERAGRQAQGRSAYSEAEHYLAQAISLVPVLGETPARARLEASLRVQYCASFVNIHGFSAPEVEQQLRRVRELIGIQGERPEVLPLMMALWGIDSGRGECDSTAQDAQRILAIAEGSGDISSLADAYHCVAASEVWRGNLETSRLNFERSWDIYQRDLDKYLPAPGAGVIPGRCNFALVLWTLGFPEQAKRAAELALSLAVRLNRPYAMAFALQFAIVIENFCGEEDQVRAQAEALVELSQEHGYPHWLASGRMTLGALIVAREDFDRGISMMREGIEGTHRLGAMHNYRFGLVLMAEALLHAGDLSGGLRALDEAADALTSGHRFHEAELSRMRGEFEQAKGNEAAALKNFQAAIEVAQHQRAKSWELRAATSLAKMLASQDRVSEARAVLAPIYEWFTEGFETRDLQLAKLLLDKIRE